MQDQPSIRLRADLLGGFGLVTSGASATRVAFRSRTAERLFAMLLLAFGREVSKGTITEAIWPDSDGDRQSQNLRRAISDIRAGLEGVPLSGDPIESLGPALRLDLSEIASDVSEFRALTDVALDDPDSVDALRSAVGLYRGALLPTCEDSWLKVHRLELEERYAQAVDRLIRQYLVDGRHGEAVRFGRQALLAAPLREDLHLALASAYASAGQHGEAIRQFEELESLLEEQWGEPPSPETVRRFESLWSTSPKAAVAIPSLGGVGSPGGAVPLESPLYVRRRVDGQIAQLIEMQSPTILVHGPRQVGKTSLVFRSAHDARRAGRKVAVTDFQMLGARPLVDGNALGQALVFSLADQLGVTIDIPAVWNEWIGPNSNLHSIVGRVLAGIYGPVIWALDEVDRLFGTPVADDFFGLVRTWHNLRAIDLDGPFSRLTIVLCYATEAHLFIEDINQSPFNVGAHLEVRDFTLSETAELAAQYGWIANDAARHRLWLLTGGHPFLTRKALDALVHTGADLDVFSETADLDDGPFGDHLRRVLRVVTQDVAVADELRRHLRGEPILDRKVLERLVAGGIVIKQPGGTCRMRVPAYHSFLSRYLLP